MAIAAKLRIVSWLCMRIFALENFICFSNEIFVASLFRTFRNADYGKELQKLGIPMLVTPNTLAADYQSYIKVISPQPVTDQSTQPNIK